MKIGECNHVSPNDFPFIARLGIRWLSDQQFLIVRLLCRRFLLMNILLRCLQIQRGRCTKQVWCHLEQSETDIGFCNVSRIIDNIYRFVQNKRNLSSTNDQSVLCYCIYFRYILENPSYQLNNIFIASEDWKFSLGIFLNDVQPRCLLNQKPHRYTVNNGKQFRNSIFSRILVNENVQTFH